MSRHDNDEERHNCTKAVLYLRISDKAQERKGNGLASQEATCREYAKWHGYEVEEVFREVMSGSVQDRPAMSSLLKHLRKCKREGRVVIVDDISRFARDIRGHWNLRDEVAAAGGILESPRTRFGDDADSIFNENIQASASQRDRQKNAERTRDRMKGRVLNGYYVFAKCFGYRYVSKAGEGRVLIRDEPIASIIQEGLEGFASGRLQSQAEVKRYFETQPDFPKDPDGTVRATLVKMILERVTYAGYVEAPQWGVSLRKGRHEPLISFETFQRAQQRLKEGAYAPARADIRADFPLRGFVACDCCKKPLTGYYASSKTGARHAYYMCFAKGCPRYRKSFQRDKVEGEFQHLLEGMTPSARLYDITRAMFKDAWTQRAAQAAAMTKSWQAQILKI